MSEIVIRAEGLGKWYDLGKSSALHTNLRDGIKQAFHRGPAPQDNRYWAIKDLAFEISKDHVVGIIGKNGAGKSTLLKILSRITEPSLGSVKIKGRVGSLLEVGTGFHPELSGRENIFLNGAIIGMKRADIRKKFDEIVEFAGIEEFLDTPVKRYSSGMYMRLAFSVAAYLDPDILIVDEVLAVGDATFQKKCLGKLRDVALRSQRTVLFVSHNLQAVQSLCNRVMHLDHGRVVAFGDTRTVVGHYLAQGTNEESAHQWEDDKAPGNDEVRLKRIAVNSGGQSNGIYSSSKAICIEIDLHSNVEADSVEVGFELITTEKIAILRTCQTDSGQNQRRRLRLGLNRWRCVLPAGLLNAGVFQVSPRIRDERGRWVIECDAIVGFEVILDHGVSPYWNSLDASTRPGVISPILDWQAVSVGVCGPAGARC